MTALYDDRLAERFEEHRARLTSIARRMLGSRSEADDAVQETWIRLSRTDADEIDDLGRWLTTVLSRVCLNTLQARRSRPEVPLDGEAPEPAGGDDPEEEVLLADTVGLALLVVLDTLSPAERVAFVLHDVFAIPFEDIAPIVRRNPPATRQLASRARRRVRGGDPEAPAGRRRQARLVEAFLAAARGGDFEGLLAVLDPDVVLRADAGVVALGAEPEVHGARAVAGWCRRARGAVEALLDGEPVLVWVHDGAPRVVYAFTVAGERIVGVDLVSDPARVAAATLVGEPWTG